MSYINSRQKLFWHIDKLEQIRATGTTIAPVNVEIDLSNRCSHGCDWCHFAYTHKRGPLAGKRERPEGAIDSGDLMPFDLANSIIRQLAGAGVQSITWTGGGEPTLHPKFDTIIEHAAMVKLKQGLYTHGGHIDADRAALLKNLMTFVYVSLDECTEEKFKVSKGVDRYWNVVAGINRLVSAPGNATVGVGFLIHPGNVSDIADMVSFGYEHSVDYVQFRPIINYSQSDPGRIVEDREHYTWLNDAIRRLERYEGNPSVVADLGRFRMYRDWNGHGYPVCHWSALQTVITPNGRLWRCTNKREHPEALLGDLSVEEFATAWARSGGSCAVDGKCRVMCRGHIANVSLDSIMTEPAHRSFI